MSFKHGMTGSPTHRSWAAMIGRCETPSDGSFGNYGGRGITVCDRWHNFVHFFADMGARPSGTSIDRIDVNGNYEPHNCRWATDAEQRHNTRATVLEAHEPAQIRWLVSVGYTHDEIARHYGVRRENVSKVARNERWRDPGFVHRPSRRSPARTAK